MIGGATMAKKAAEKSGAEKSDPDEMVTKALKVRREYGDWLDRLAAFNRTTVAGLIDQSLARYAREVGFKEDPPERTP
jgi:hypothetical protein